MCVNRCSVWNLQKDLFEKELLNVAELEHESVSQLILHIKGEAHSVPVHWSEDIDMATDKVLTDFKLKPEILKYTTIPSVFFVVSLFIIAPCFIPFKIYVTRPCKDKRDYWQQVITRGLLQMLMSWQLAQRISRWIKCCPSSKR
jgi:hypothetical protein